jgi:allantoicase
MKAHAVPFEKFVNLADARLGTKIISVTDDWFADANRLFQPTPPCGRRACSMTTASGWTAGSRAASASKATTAR